MQDISEIVLDAFIDSVKLLPFLFLAYAAMEYMEHKMGKKTEEAVGRAGRFGPVLGAVCGIFPQCGFPAAASDLFAGRMITMGTLLAVFLSASDEMLPILLSEQVGIGVVLKLLGMKAVIGMTAGFLVDLVIRKRQAAHRRSKPGGEGRRGTDLRHICRREEYRCEVGVSGGKKIVCADSCHICRQEEHCCGDGIFRQAVRHTVQVFLFIFIFSLVLNLVIGMAGDEFLAGLLLERPVAGPLVAGLVGLVPNCAASVILTQLYLEGMMGLGAMMAGLLAGSGVGLLVLFRVSDNMKECAAVTALLYGIGVTAGVLLDVAGIAI